VADFIKWAKAQGIPVGPGPRLGRGLAGGLGARRSPISIRSRFGLLFERFLNPERVSMPDFDIDFCQDPARRGDPLCPAEATARTASRRSSPSARCRRARVLRDVGRVLQMPLRAGRPARASWCRSNPANPCTLAQRASTASRSLQSASTDASPSCAPDRISRMKLEGSAAQRLDPRGRRRHRRPAARRSSCRSTAIPQSDMPVTQFNMKCVEPAGLVKFDFLGLKTLTVLAQGRSI